MPLAQAIGTVRGRSGVRRRALLLRARASRCLSGVSFHAPAGTTTALVGSSGSGKSTLISLVMAFNRPQSGVIRVDGRDLSAAQAARLSQPARHRPAGQLPVRRHRRRQHRLLEARRDPRGDRGGRRHRALRGVRRRVREGIRHGRRRARREAVGRPAPAHRHRAGDPGRPAHPDSRRGDVEPRQRERGADPGWPARAAARPDHVRHRAPALDDPKRRPDPGAGARRDRRARHAQPAAGAATGATASSTTSSTTSRRTGSSIRGRTSRRSRRWKPCPRRRQAARSDDNHDGARARRSRRSFG